MKKIGITGSSGFIGSHLLRWLTIRSEKFQVVEINRDDFSNNLLLDSKLKEIDILVHLAGKNRSSDYNEIEATNINLAKLIIKSLERVNSKPHVIISSSTQESQNNIYGKSKRISRELFVEWSNRSVASFTGLIIPNVFGPFSKPYYNTVVATFCHQLVNNQIPSVDIDNILHFIYIDELIHVILDIIENKKVSPEFLVSQTSTISVNELLNRLSNYKTSYFVQGQIPLLENSFDLNLFNTFRSFLPHNLYFPKLYKVNKDDRGVFVELARLAVGGQVSYSTTYPGITRGNHFHTRKIERFAVISGKALIQLRQIGYTDVHSFYLDGEEPAYVDMPVWYTHNISNIGDTPLYTVFWISEFYDSNDPDTYIEEV